MRKKLEIVDATCPFVKKAREHVKSLSQAGYDVVVVGDADHPEVQGIVSYARERFMWSVPEKRPAVSRYRERSAS